MNRFALALISTLVFATPAAHAIEYSQVQADKSQINFGYQQMGVSMDGSFKTFSSQLRFDPAAPQTGSATIEVDLASIDTGSPKATRRRRARPGSTPRTSPRPASNPPPSRRSAATSTRSPAS